VKFVDDLIGTRQVPYKSYWNDRIMASVRSTVIKAGFYCWLCI